MSYNVKISEDERDDFEMELKQVNTNKPYAFVSYANADIIQVQADVKRLQNAGVNLWIDTELSRYGFIGRNWKNVVRRAMRDSNCKAVLLFVSKFSLGSDAVRYELDMSCSEDISGMHYGNKLPIIIIRVTQFTAIKSFCYEMAEEYGDSLNESDIPDSGRTLSSENVLYIMNRYLNNEDILHQSIFNIQNQKWSAFLEGMERFGIKSTDESEFPKQSVSDLLEKGRFLKRRGDVPNALQYLQLAAEYGSADAYLEIGRIYCSKRRPTVQEYKQAQSCLIRAIDLGREEAKLDLAICFYNAKEHRLTQKYLKEVENSEIFNSSQIRDKYNEIKRRL